MQTSEIITDPNPRKSSVRNVALVMELLTELIKVKKETRLYLEVYFSYLLWDEGPDGERRLCSSVAFPAVWEMAIFKS